MNNTSCSPVSPFPTPPWPPLEFPASLLLTSLVTLWGLQQGSYTFNKVPGYSKTSPQDRWTTTTSDGFRGGGHFTNILGSFLFCSCPNTFKIYTTFTNLSHACAGTLIKGVTELNEENPEPAFPWELKIKKAAGPRRSVGGTGSLTSLLSLRWRKLHGWASRPCCPPCLPYQPYLRVPPESEDCA